MSSWVVGPRLVGNSRRGLAIAFLRSRLTSSSPRVSVSALKGDGDTDLTEASLWEKAARRGVAPGPGGCTRRGDDSVFCRHSARHD